MCNATGSNLVNTRAARPAPERLALDDWTVVTIASDGSWGVATDISTSSAIAKAIANCRKMSQAHSGCGAYFTAIRGGWSLGFRCGSENIIVAAHELAEAERAAVYREIDLKHRYVPDMPPCRRILSVDPQGALGAQERMRLQ
jgi:hypothetical protein